MTWRFGAASRRTVAALALAVIAVLLSATPAVAHAGLIGSDPADGVVLDSPPTTMTLRFDEAVVVDQTSITLAEVGGSETATRKAQPVGADEASTVTFSLPVLTKGAYEVTWKAVSGSDRHTSTGVVVFGVGTPPPVVAAADPWPPLGDAVFRTLALIGLTVALGAVAVLLLITFRLPSAATGESASPLSRLAATTGAALAGVALVADLGLLFRAATGSSLANVLTQSTYGQRWLAGFVSIAMLLVLLFAAIRLPTRVVCWLAAAVGLVAVALQPLDSHLAAGTSSWLGSVAAAAHLAAAGAWAGGLVVLVVLALHAWLRPAGASEPEDVRRLFVGFAWLALPAAAVLVLSGLLLTGRQVATPDALLFTHYGRVLLAKVALVVVIGCFGLWHARQLHPRPESAAGVATPRRVPRTVIIEAAVFLLVLVAAGVLGGSSPPKGIPWLVPPPARPALPVTTQVFDLTLTVSITPGVTGPNVLAVQALETREPSPGPVLLVSAKVTDPSGATSTVPLTPGETENRWRAALDLPSPGTYSVTVTLARSGLPDTSTTTRWPIAAAPVAARPVDVSNVSIAPITRWLAFALLVGLAVAAAIALAVRDSAPGDDTTHGESTKEAVTKR